MKNLDDILNMAKNVQDELAKAQAKSAGGPASSGSSSTLLGSASSTAADADKAVTFELHEFTDEWQEYPWHLAAAFVDDDDAFVTEGLDNFQRRCLGKLSTVES